MQTASNIKGDVAEHQENQAVGHAKCGSRPPIRVLLMTNSVAIGGMEKHVEMLARDLGHDAADVYAICPRWEETAPWAATLSQIVGPTDHFAQITPDRRYGWLSLAKETVRLWRQLRRWRIQVLHLHLTTYEGGVWTVIAARLAGVQSIFCTEHLAPEHPLSSRRRLRRNLTTRCFNGIVSVSLKNRRAREQYLFTPANKTTVVNNGIDLTNFSPTPPQEIADLRSQLGIPPNVPVVGTAVRFVEEKGLPYLLDAMPRVLAAAPDTYLLLVGDGPLREALEQQATALGYRDRVIFAGFQADPRSYLSLMDAFVLPVPFGSASIGLLEAMAMRRAVIITFGGDGEAVIDGETGLCPPPRDPEALAGAILRVILHPDFGRQLGANARERIEQSFSSRNVATQLLALYQESIGIASTVCHTPASVAPAIGEQ